MSGFCRHIAFFLLVIFARVLVPDALILRLHAHAHTEHALTVEEDESHPKLEHAHAHCPVENLFHSPFQFASAGQEPVSPAYLETYSITFRPIWDFFFSSTVTLRGPPVG